MTLLDTERRVHFFADLGERASVAHAVQAPVQTSAMDAKVHWDRSPLSGPEASAGQRWHTFTLPAAGQPWHWAFTSCAAFSSGTILN